MITQMVVDGAKSRLELCGRLGLSKAAVTQVVSKLLKSGLIEEGLRFSNSGKGRKTTTLRVKPDLAYLLGTDLEGMAVRVCIIDCEKKVIAGGKRAIGPDWSIRKILNQWLSIIEEVIDRSGILPEKMAGIGVGLPGKVSRENFHCRAYLPPGRWVDLNIGSVLEKFNLAVTAANNVVCAAEYERRLGSARQVKNFISILARYGIGAAIFSNSSFLAGEEFFTGELGHMRVDCKGPVCVCGQRGCLDVFASGRTWRQEKIRTDAMLHRELSSRGRYLAIGVANLLKVFHPALLIINGIYNEYENEFRPILLSALDAELKGLQLSVPEVVFGEPVDFKASIGAAMRAADEFLEAYLEKNLFGKRAGRRKERDR